MYPCDTMRVSLDKGLLIKCVYLFVAIMDSSCGKYDGSSLESAFYSDRVLTITTILIEPYAMLKRGNLSGTQSGPSDLYEGFIVDLLNHLADIIGFRYRLVPVWDGQFGYRGLDGSWDGMVGELLRQEADVAAAPMFVTEQRRKVVDFSRPFMTVQATVMIRKPPEGQRPAILSVRDLLNHPTLEYGTLDHGLIKRAFRMSNVSLYRAMWDHMRTYQEVLLTDSNEDGIHRVRTNNYAYILPNTIAEYVIRREPCDLIMVDSFMLHQTYSLATRKGSSLLPYLSRAIDILHEDGYLHTLYERWWIEKGDCNPVRTSRMFSYNIAAVNVSAYHRVSTICVLYVIFSFSYR